MDSQILGTPQQKSRIYDSKYRDRTSVIPRNVYVQCPSHAEHEITNFCLECMEPLCPECVKHHTNLHTQMKKPLEFDTIQNVRNNTLEYLRERILIFQKEKETLSRFSDKRKIELKEVCFAKIRDAKEKVVQIVNSFFLTLEQKTERALQLHKLSHPGEYNRVNERVSRALSDLDRLQAKIKGPDYVKPVLKVERKAI